MYLIDPVSGVSKAEPFVAPFDKNKPTDWLKPVAMENDSVALVDQAGIVRRVVKATDPQPRLQVTNETRLGSPVVADPVSTGIALLVVTEDGKVRALSARDLSPLTSWTLEARLTAGPFEAQHFVFLADASGKLHAFDPSGKKLWSVEGKEPAGAPVVSESTVWLLCRDGALEARSMADGSPTETWSLGILPAGGLITNGAQVAVPVTPGSLRLLSKIQAIASPANSDKPAAAEPVQAEKKDPSESPIEKSDKPEKVEKPAEAGDAPR